MDTTIVKLNELHQSVQKLETALHEVWAGIDEIREDEQFSDLCKKRNTLRKRNNHPMKTWRNSRL
jgi:hypothetical protein